MEILYLRAKILEKILVCNKGGPALFERKSFGNKIPGHYLPYQLIRQE